ncbi:MAG: hypothetical protein K1Y36_14400 [Blastocatellia bacterium]|nr:hypothetical protein [Blastocatellia bacterium]
MPDQKLILRNITLPTRCEICHQADRFNPETGRCTRCQQISTAVPQSKDAIQSTSIPPSHVITGPRLMLAAGICLLIGFGSCTAGIGFSGQPGEDFLEWVTIVSYGFGFFGFLAGMGQAVIEQTSQALPPPESQRDTKPMTKHQRKP